MTTISIRELIESGVHFGHKVSKWNPKMRPYIYGKRNLIHIIDLKKTLMGLVKACKFLSATASRGGKVLFVGTKKQAKTVITAEAKRSNQYYASERWIGGTLTNFETIAKRIQRLVELETLEKEGILNNYTKKENSRFMREKKKLLESFEGIRNMSVFPRAIVVVDPKKEKNAIAEARALHIPIIALIDTDGDPNEIDFPIPGNDDAMKVIQIIIARLADSVIDGSSRMQAQPVAQQQPEKSASYAPQRRRGGYDNRPRGGGGGGNRPYDRHQSPAPTAPASAPKPQQQHKPAAPQTPAKPAENTQPTV
ncbi:MAG: 30S ribosomal protein S2 [Planctomycetes bacterium]|nr:30S ribosomal protein S2 [Planctomycetota bacterium]